MEWHKASLWAGLDRFDRDHWARRLVLSNRHTGNPPPFQRTAWHAAFCWCGPTVIRAEMDWPQPRPGDSLQQPFTPNNTHLKHTAGAIRFRSSNISPHQSTLWLLSWVYTAILFHSVKYGGLGLELHLSVLPDEEILFCHFKMIIFWPKRSYCSGPGALVKLIPWEQGHLATDCLAPALRDRTGQAGNGCGVRLRGLCPIVGRKLGQLGWLQTLLLCAHIWRV